MMRTCAGNGGTVDGFQGKQMHVIVLSCVLQGH